MRTKFSGILTLLLAFAVQFTFAQQQNISGTVSDDIGLPLPGVNIIIKGTTTGTQSDFDGNYSINASAGQTLVFSYVGFATQERAVTASTSRIDLEMSQGEELGTVIVTALGISREKRSLGYSVSEVESESIEQRSEGDLNRVLAGKVAGLNVTNTSGISGSATSVVIRTPVSITGGNGALYVIDGVPFSNDTNTTGSFLTGNSGSSRTLDIDPNNIESVSVLKGFAAATLYGSDGKNGVILITTKGGAIKRGPSKSEITVTQGVSFNEIASLPNFTNTFGNGFDQSFGNFFSNWGPGFYAEGLGGYLEPSSNINPDGTFPHPYDRANLAGVFPEFQGATLPWVAAKNHVKEFFRSGLVLNTSVNVGGASDDGKIAYNFNYGRLEDEGFTPGNKINRDTYSLGGRAQLSNKFSVNGTFNFANTRFKTPPVAFSSGSSAQNGISVFGDIFYTPRNLPLMDLPFQNPVTGQSVYYRGDDRLVNPNWVVANASVSQVTNRFFSSATFNYEFNDNLNLSYRFGLDNYSLNTANRTNRGVGFPASSDLGEYTTLNTTNTITEHQFLLSGLYKLSDDFGLNFNLGVNSKRENFQRFGLQSLDQIVFDTFKHFNFTETNTFGEFERYRNLVGVFGTVDIDFKNGIYLNLAARNDWVSNIIENSQFYPSASVSFVPTTLFPGLRSDNLNYLKLRGGYGTSAGFPTGFPVSQVVGLNPNAFVANNGDVIISNSNLVGGSSLLANAGLRPELYAEIEVGFETIMFNNRINLDFSYYSRTTKDLLINRPTAFSTGSTVQFANISETDGYGFEVDLGIDIFKKENGFNWKVNTNYNKYRAGVVSLGDGFEEGDLVNIAGFTNLGNFASAGESLGYMGGTTVARDDNGNLIVDDSGNYLSETGVNKIGDYIPDFVMNLNNRFEYRGLSFEFLINYVHGGDIFSNTIGGLLARGITQDTDERLGTLILPGVKQDGTPNDIQVNASQYYFDNLGFGPTELRVYDATTIRLSEVSLGYSLPSKFLAESPFGSVSFALAGYNLYYNAINTPKHINFDPNIAGTGAGNGGGFDFLNGPSGKRYGFTVKATF